MGKGLAGFGASALQKRGDRGIFLYRLILQIDQGLGSEGERQGQGRGDGTEITFLPRREHYLGTHITLH